jgi:uncharacterized radical SAM protein YgiQ
MKQAPLPMTLEEAHALGWDALDVILVTGDCYVDHPSFGAALVGRYLQSLGLRVGVIASPDPENEEDFTRLGEPTMFFGVTAGALDSMIMLKTAQKKHRSDDAYAQGGMAGRRPPRAVMVYCNRIRRYFKGAKIIIGGVEASLRRFAHYDFWEEKVRGSVLPDSKADMLVYGMGERPLAQIVAALRDGKSLREIKDVRGTAVMIDMEGRKAIGAAAKTIPALDEVAGDKAKYARASRMIHMNQNPHCATALVQKHGGRYVLVNPPAFPMSTPELDAIYALPFTRAPHPSYTGKIPAYEMIRHSITAMRGCFGGCAFCSLTAHQGRAVQSRSAESILAEVEKVTAMPDFTGHVSDIGGPTANMYMMYCGQPEVEKICRKVSCVHPKVCHRLVTDHEPQIELLRKARVVKGVKKVFIASGVRYDLAILSPEYIKELARHHVSGQLKVAPEHSDPAVLRLMRKPPAETYDQFVRKFMEESAAAGLPQFVAPYFISAHPGCGLEREVELALYLKSRNIRPRQMQDFIPIPMTLAGDMYYCGFDPISGWEVKTDTGGRARRLHRALIQYFEPENADDVREALHLIGREDLIGSGPGKLVRSRPGGGGYSRGGPAPEGRFKGRNRRE